jgi:hypothetical protein
MLEGIWVASPVIRVCGIIAADETIETIHDITRKNFAVTPTISNVDRPSF